MVKNVIMQILRLLSNQIQSEEESFALKTNRIMKMPRMNGLKDSSLLCVE